MGAKIWRLAGMVSLLVLLFVMPAQAVDAGRPDSATLGDYISHFFMRVASYSNKPWRIDTDSSNIRLAIDAALFDISTNPALSDACRRKATFVTRDDSVSLWAKLPNDCNEVQYVTQPNPSGRGEFALKAIAQDEIGGNTSDNGKPIYYCVFGDSIYFDPNNQAGDTLFVYYAAYSNKLTADTVVSNVKMRYFNLGVELAIINFYQGRRGADVAGVIAQAKDQIALIATHLGIRPESVLPQIK